MIKHSASSLHTTATKAIALSNGKSIVEKIDIRHKKHMVSNRVALSKIFSTINLLGQQGLPFRGRENDENSNFLKFLHTRAEDVADLKRWLSSDEKRKWLSHDIQNEILGLLSCQVLQKLINEIRESDFFSILLDETPDCASLEQLSICVRVVSDKYVTSDTSLGSTM